MWLPVLSDLALLGCYQPLIDARTADEPFVIAQLGQSLDGCIATISGDSYFVTGPESLLHLHRLRALSDVVLVGAGTVAADNPRLTTRRVEGPQPVRAVLDPQGRLDGSSGVFVDGAAPTLWICDTRVEGLVRNRTEEGAGAAAGSAAGSAAKVEVVAIEGLLGDDGYDSVRVIDALQARGLRRIFIEGGGITVSRFMRHGCLDRLHLIVAPVFIGDGRPGLRLPPWQTMAQCPRPPASTVKLGDDLLWDLNLRASTPAIAPSA